jgi:acyl-ACP thioesterase
MAAPGTGGELLKAAQTTRVYYDDVDADFRMKLPVLFQRLQRAAVHHSDLVGQTNEKMVADGAVWILNRMLVKIERMPAFRERLTVHTWHKGAVGFRSARDFLVFCNQELVAAASSQWLFFDLHKKRIVKIPAAVSEPYGVETDEALGADAIDFAVDKAFDAQQTISITTRDGDYDPNGHVNNTAYLDYLDTLIKRSGLTASGLTRVGIQYFKEIGRNVQSLQAGLAVGDGTALFRFFGPDAVYAAGFAGFGE